MVQHKGPLRMLIHLNRQKTKEGRHYVIGLSIDGVKLARLVTESLCDGEVFVHVDISKLSDVSSAVSADKVRQCRRDLLQLIDNHSLVRQLAQLHLVISHHTTGNTYMT